MESEYPFTPDSIRARADAAKSLAADASGWITAVQLLPVDAADDEYWQSPSEGDSLVEQLLQSRERVYDGELTESEWRIDILRKLEGPMVRRRSAVANLLASVILLEHGYRFGNEANECRIDDRSAV